MTQRDAQLGVHRAINHRLPARLRNREFSNVSFASPPPPPRRRYRYATRRPRKEGGKTVEPLARATNTPVPPPVSFSRAVVLLFLLPFSFTSPSSLSFSLSLFLILLRFVRPPGRRRTVRRVEIPRGRSSLRLFPSCEKIPNRFRPGSRFRAGRNLGSSHATRLRRGTMSFSASRGESPNYP